MASIGAALHTGRLMLDVRRTASGGPHVLMVRLPDFVAVRPPSTLWCGSAPGHQGCQASAVHPCAHHSREGGVNWPTAVTRAGYGDTAAAARPD